MAGWPKGLTKEAARALSPEERRKLWNKPKEEAAGLSYSEKARLKTEGTPVRDEWAETMKRQAKSAKKSWTMRAGNNWETAVEVEENPDEFYIPRDQFPEGMDLQWWTREVLGQETRQRVSTARRGGWTEVHDSDFDGWHKSALGGRYGLDESGFIVHKGLGLFARPNEVSDRSRKRDLKRARDQIAMKEQAFKGGEINATGANHPSAVSTNRINRSIERIEVPKE